MLALQSAADPALRRAVPARRPRRPDPGHDRLLVAAGPAERAARQAGRHDPRPDPGLRGRPGVHRRRPSSSARSTTEAQADRLAAERGWTIAQDGPSWRRVVPSPPPQRDRGDPDHPTLLVEPGPWWSAPAAAAIPVVRDEHRAPARGRGGGRQGPDHRGLLAESLDADALLLLTDVPAVRRGFGTPHAAADPPRHSRRAAVRGTVRRRARWGPRSKRPADSSN